MPTRDTTNGMLIADLLNSRGYCLGPRIGKGSYAKVKIVERLSDNKIMAVKIISPRQTAKEFLETFLPRELSVILSLNHQNIIQVYEIIQTHEVVCIMMEYASQGDLLDYVKRIGVLQEDEACFLYAQVCEGVNYLHDRYICHRDLKCENILLRRNMTVALSDFGFSRTLPRRDTLSSTYCGSVAYASPELLKGTPYLPLQNDIWSLGCILFIMVTGEMPFCDKSTRKMIHRQLKGKVSFPEHRCVSMSCRSLIANMLEPNIDLRYNIKAVLAHPWLQHSSYSENEPCKGHPGGLQTNIGSTYNYRSQVKSNSKIPDIDNPEKKDTRKENSSYKLPARKSSNFSNDSANENSFTPVFVKTSLCRMPGEACIIRGREVRNEDNDSAGRKHETPTVSNTSNYKKDVSDSLSVNTNPTSSTALSSTSGDRDMLPDTGSALDIKLHKNYRILFKGTAVKSETDSAEGSAQNKIKNIFNTANESMTLLEDMGAPSSGGVSYMASQQHLKSVSKRLECQSKIVEFTQTSRSMSAESNAAARQSKHDICVQQEYICQAGLVTKLRHIFESKNNVH